MNINIKIDELLDKLNSAHKIILNDKGMMIIKLHNNKIFENWLREKNTMPMIKKFHSINENKEAIPLFITLGIIPNKTLRTINISCCDLDMQQLANNVFENKSDSGIIINGSYFYLRNHVLNRVYGLDSSKNIYDTSKLSNNNKIEFKPIGYFHYDMDRFGKIIKKEEHVKIYNKTYDNISLEEPVDKITLKIIKNTLGVIIFNNDGNVKIEKISNYNNNNYKNNEANIAMGNLLIYNNEIIFTEKIISTAILLVEINGIKKFEKIHLCNNNDKFLNGNELNKLDIGNIVNYIYFEKGTPNIKKGTIEYNDTNIYLPYFLNLLKKKYPTDFNGIIPPGYPNHASDLNPRTCALIDDNNNIIFMQVEGRNNICGGIGIDLFDLAKLCNQLGAKYAINLDGGGSSKMIWKEKNNTMSYVGLKTYNLSNAIVIK